MSPQEIARIQATELAEREARSLLGVSLDQALAKLDAGELTGTAAEAELRMLRFVLDR